MPTPVVWDLYEDLIEIQERRVYRDTPYPYEIFRMRVNIPDSFDLSSAPFPGFIRLHLQGEEKHLRVMDYTVFNEMQSMPIHYGRSPIERFAGSSRVYVDITGIVQDEMDGYFGEDGVSASAESAMSAISGSRSLRPGWTDVRETELEELRKRSLPGFSDPQKEDKLIIGGNEYIFNGKVWKLSRPNVLPKPKKGLYSRKLRIRKKK